MLVFHSAHTPFFSFSLFPLTPGYMCFFLFFPSKPPFFSFGSLIHVWIESMKVYAPVFSCISPECTVTLPVTHQTPQQSFFPSSFVHFIYLLLLLYTQSTVRILYCCRRRRRHWAGEVHSNTIEHGFVDACARQTMLERTCVAINTFVDRG